MTIGSKIVARALFALVFVASSAPLPSLAIEPDPPETLISEFEALRIAVGLRLEKLPRGKPPAEQADRTHLSAFYASNANGLLWIKDQGPTKAARAVLSEIARADDWGLRRSDYDLPQTHHKRSSRRWSFKRQVEFELRTSLAILKYARQARDGRVDPRHLSLAFDHKPKQLPVRSVLHGAANATNPAKFLHGLHPQHEQFHRLRRAYLRSRADERQGARTPRQKITGGDAAGSNSRDSSISLTQRFLINMEMWRWMPASLGSRYIWANIPEFTFRLMDRSGVLYEERMIVGKPKHMTPVFSDYMETVVFRPFWNVPNSIKVKEILPGLLRDRSTLRRKNLRVAYGGREINPWRVDWSRADIRNYHVYQPPGSSNALGKVKFLFPNRHAVYMHDTPKKSLFRRDRRAFSHGCMRVRNPLKFAEVLLRHDRGWDRTNINRLARSGPDNNSVELRKKIPVHVTYFTAHIDRSGLIETFPDIYRHEQLIKLGLDGQISQIEKPKPEDLEETRSQIIANAPPRRARNLQGAPYGLGGPQTSPIQQRAPRRRTRWRERVLFGSDS